MLLNIHLRLKEQNNRLPDHVFVYIGKNWQLHFLIFISSLSRYFVDDFISDSTILVWKISAAKKSFSESIASPHFSNVFRFSWWQNSKMSINFTNTRNIFFRYLLTFFQNLYRCLKIRFLSSLTVWVNRGKRYLFFKGFVVTVEDML